MDSCQISNPGLQDVITAMDKEQSTSANPVISSPSTTTTSPKAQTQPISLCSGGERQTIQVIQQALHRPSNSAAQYLQQMYAAQQQHIMLQSAAVQPPHIGCTPLQSLAAIQQAGLSGGRRSTSPTGNFNPLSNMSQTSVNLSAPPTPAQLISRTHVSSTSSSSITQQTMLLGSTSPTLTSSQAQMYLRAQMLIFTPAVTVAAVHSDIPVSSSSSSTSCKSEAARVQNVNSRSQHQGVLSCTQKSPPRISTPVHSLAIGQKPTIISSKVVQSDVSSELNRKMQSSSPESQCTTVTHTSSLHQLIPTASYFAVEPHSLVKQKQITSHSVSSKEPCSQFLQQQKQQAEHQNHPQQQQHQEQQHIQLMQQQLQNQSLDSPTRAHCAQLHSDSKSPVSSSITALQSSLIQTRPSSLSASPTRLHSSQHSIVSPPHTQSSSKSPSSFMHPQTQCPVPSSLQFLTNSLKLTSDELQPDQQLHSPSNLARSPTTLANIGLIQQANMGLSVRPDAILSNQKHSILQTAPSVISIPKPTAMSSPTNIHSLPMKSFQEQPMKTELLSPGKVRVHHVLISEDELPAAEALVQLPFQTIPPPQTVAVNLRVQPTVTVELPPVYQVDEACDEDMPEASADDHASILRTPTPPTLSPQCVCTGNGHELISENRLPACEEVLKEASPISSSVIKFPSDSCYASIPPPPLLLPAAATRSTNTLMPPSIPTKENKPPQAIVRPQILTHVIEGFVIQEGLEPFPVNRYSLLVKKHDKTRLLSEKQVMSITCQESELEDHLQHPEFTTDTDMEDTVAEGLEEMQVEQLKCEFCGKMGYTNKFHRSKRFCSISCAKRYTKRLGHNNTSKKSHWIRKSDKNLNRCVRRSSGSQAAVREHFVRQDNSRPTPMTTRLRRQSERERELRGQRKRIISESDHLLQHPQRDTSMWTVEEVWAFIHSLPGCHIIADEFRIQEIDGQALLLLKEDHLMGAMNIKLGPALKICAHIKSLRES
ncbi:polyhomeotic-like protein 3 isoform X2 [Ambystoma mexicanum]|uniref:polyhomeotic-like protein 3 isoform X2 n=1 Tax=Ambystoma mexicanum TaxID=8296 RepID=UPI0037E8F071